MEEQGQAILGQVINDEGCFATLYIELRTFFSQIIFACIAGTYEHEVSVVDGKEIIHRVSHLSRYANERLQERPTIYLREGEINTFIPLFVSIMLANQRRIGDIPLLLANSAQRGICSTCSEVYACHNGIIDALVMQKDDA